MRDAEFSAFVSGQGERLIKLGLYLTGDRHRAEDLVQSVLERTYLRWGRVRNDPVAYVRRALVNASTDAWRRTGSRETLVADPPEPAPDDDGTELLADRDHVIKTLARLTLRERSVLVLRYYEDLSEAEIAAVLRIAPGTVKSTSARALAKLRIATAPAESPSRTGGTSHDH